MERKHGTTRYGHTFQPSEILAVWQKGTPITGKDPSQYRKDKCGATMYFHAHGNTEHPNGWEIDHINPVSKGGSDERGNLQPLHWRNNRSKSDNPATSAYCVIRN